MADADVFVSTYVVESTVENFEETFPSSFMIVDNAEELECEKDSNTVLCLCRIETLWNIA